MPMTPKAARVIARDYWIFNGWAAATLISGSAMEGWSTPAPGHYFLATCFVIYAHARRNHQTLLALHPDKEQR